MAQREGGRQRKRPRIGTIGEYSKRLLRLAQKQPGQSQAIQDDPFQVSGMYGIGSRKFVLPPLGEGSLRTLIQFHDESNILPQCVAAYQENIDGFGVKFEKRVNEEFFPKNLDAAQQQEALELEAWFEYCFDLGSFVDLRKRARFDRETTGISYWEVLRDQQKPEMLTGFRHVPSYTVRIAGLDPAVQVIDEVRMVGLEARKAKVARQFRLYCQILTVTGRIKKVWFKEFGDPRTFDADTGEEVPKGTKTQRAATELMVFRNYHPLTPYGLPRWIGNLPSVLGSRAAEEINVLYFDNKAIPPLVVTVSGGQLTQASMDEIKDGMESIMGRENWHQPLVLEATTEDGGSRGRPARPQIHIQPLTDKMIKDAMFMGYDAANQAKNRSSFRLPPILAGDTKDFNRATAEIAMMTTEEQVFRPERTMFDYGQNRWVLPALGARYSKMVSIGPNVTLNQDLIQLLTAGTTAGGLTPNLARAIISDIMEKEIPPIEEEWGDLPWTGSVASPGEKQLPPVVAPSNGTSPNGGPPADQQPTSLEQEQAALVQEQAKLDRWCERQPVAVKKAMVRFVRDTMQRMQAEARQ